MYPIFSRSKHGDTFVRECPSSNSDLDFYCLNNPWSIEVSQKIENSQERLIAISKSVVYLKAAMTGTGFLYGQSTIISARHLFDSRNTKNPQCQICPSMRDQFNSLRRNRQPQERKNNLPFLPSRFHWCSFQRKPSQ